MNRWKFLATTTVENYNIDGANVFEAEDGEKNYFVRDPLYKQKHIADIYYHKGKTAVYKIAIAEFSFGVYGIYVHK